MRHDESAGVLEYGHFVHFPGVYQAGIDGPDAGDMVGDDLVPCIEVEADELLPVGPDEAFAGFGDIAGLGNGKGFDLPVPDQRYPVGRDGVGFFLGHTFDAAEVLR